MNNNPHTIMVWASIAWLATLMPSHGIGLTGTDREDGFKTVFRNCYQAERTEKGYDLADLERFCRCYSNAFVDLVTPEQIQMLNETVDVTILGPLVNEAASKCPH